MTWSVQRLDGSASVHCDRTSSKFDLQLLFASVVVVCWLLNVPATCKCISGTDTCCHTEIEVADQTFHLTQSQFTDTGPTCPSTDSITLGVWQGSHWSSNFEVTGMTRPLKKIPAEAELEPGIFRSRGGRLNHFANEAVDSERRTVNLSEQIPP